MPNSTSFRSSGQISLQLLKEAQAAELLGVSQSWLQKRRVRRQSPKHIRLGGSIRYRMADLETFIEEQSAIVVGEDV